MKLTIAEYKKVLENNNSDFIKTDKLLSANYSGTQIAAVRHEYNIKIQEYQDEIMLFLHPEDHAETLAGEVKILKSFIKNNIEMDSLEISKMFIVSRKKVDSYKQFLGHSVG